MATLSRPRSRRGAVLIPIFAVPIGLVICFLAVANQLYLHPISSPVRPVDAILVLGPPSESRVTFAERLMEQGYASTLVLSVKPTPPTARDFVDACTGERSYEVVCFVPEPYTTQGEARTLRDLASEHDWTEVMVVTMPTHLTRASVIVRHCYQGGLAMVAAPRKYSLGETLEQFVYQSAAFVKVALDPSC